MASARPRSSVGLVIALASALASLPLALAQGCGGDDDSAADGGRDAGRSDGGGPIDAAVGDGGGGGGDDGAVADGGTPEDAGADGGVVDAGPADAGTTDASTTDASTTDASTTDDGGALDGGPAPTGPFIYLARRDTRRCVYPLCGGFWLSVVNAPTTVCPDGSSDLECYVAEIDWTALGLTTSEVTETEASAGNLIVQGMGELRTVGGRPGLGVLVASAAWRAAWATREILAGTSTWYSVQDNGLSCLVPPCFSLDLVVLNRGTRATASGLDLGGTGASAPEIARGNAAAATGDLRVLGTISTDATPGPGGAFGRTLDAQQFFLPVP